jgi:hypothetical protein
MELNEIAEQKYILLTSFKMDLLLFQVGKRLQFIFTILAVFFPLAFRNLW